MLYIVYTPGLKMHAQLDGGKKFDTLHLLFTGLFIVRILPGA
jgi:hypothetical protein